MENQSDPQPYRLTRKIISIRPVAWLLSHAAHLFDRLLMSLTKGRYSLSALITGLPVINLTATGAKSGRPRTVPLLGIPDGPNLILIASNWGRGRHPGWYYNVRANPEVQVEVDGRSIPYSAREVQGPERERYWRTAVQCYPGYEAYKKWTGGREIPVIVLAPTNRQ